MKKLFMFATNGSLYVRSTTDVMTPEDLAAVVDEVEKAHNVRIFMVLEARLREKASNQDTITITE